MITKASRLLTLAALTHALPPPSNDLSTFTISSTNGSRGSNSSYSLPMFDPNPAARWAEIADNRAGYVYGPSLIGNSSFFPTGSKGDQLWQSEVTLWNQSAAPQRAAVGAEAAQVQQTLAAVCFLCFKGDWTLILF